jgi:hypothetical protein
MRLMEINARVCLAYTQSFFFFSSSPADIYFLQRAEMFSGAVCVEFCELSRADN